MRGSSWIAFLMICIAAGLALAAPAGAAERCVVAELFTQTMWTGCAIAEAALDSVVKYDFSSEELAVIKAYWETESLFYYAPASFRFNFFYPGAHISPTLWVDGVDVQEGFVWDLDSTWSVYRDMIQTRRDLPSPAVMDMMVEYGAKNDTGTVHFEVVATDSIAFTDLHLRMALTEDDISTKATYDQVLRRYLPNGSGIAFAMAEGDTFTHSQEFIVDSTWTAGNCKIVAFVQDDVTREALQAIQDWVVPPAPATVSDLTITLSENDLALDWSPVTENTKGQPVTVDSYYVYRDTVPTFGSGGVPLDATTSTFYLDDTGVVGDTGIQYHYSVTAVAGGKESALSGAVGEFDTDLASN